MGSHRDLIVYKKAFELAMKIFTVTKQFPKEEMFGLTGQMRRSSRSVCSCMAEAYRKRKYPAHFICKLTDCDMENTETQTWLDFSIACEYINQETYDPLFQISSEVGRLLGHMIENPEKYGGK